MYSLAVITSALCPFQPPLSFDATDATFPLIDRCRPISASLVGSPPIFRIMGVGKSMRNSLVLIVAPVISSRALGGIDGGFIPWENSSNMLKCVLIIRLMPFVCWY